VVERADDAVVILTLIDVVFDPPADVRGVEM
jgi:hypothetical protein